MKRIESVWREILLACEKKRDVRLTQMELAKRLGISVSTVFAALRLPRKSRAVHITGRDFTVRAPEKILYLWCSYRDLEADLFYKTRVDLSAREIEGRMPPSVIYGAYSAYRLSFGEPPADYDTVYVYGEPTDRIQAEIKRRFPPKKGPPNLFLIKKDPFLDRQGRVTPPVQTFVDLWNLPEWYARNFLAALKEKLHGLLA